MDQYRNRLSINALIRDGCLKTPGTSWTTTWYPLCALSISLGFKYLGYALKVVNSSGGVITVNISKRRVGPEGWRQHFECPRCTKCVDVLYVVNFKDFENGLGCRHCLDLAYGSTTDDDAGRAMRLIHALRERVGWVPGFGNASPRPKGMHWRTYRRRLHEQDALICRYGRQPMFARSTARFWADIARKPVDLEMMIDALKRLPENEEAVWVALDQFEQRYGRLLTEADHARLIAAFPPPPPGPPRIEGGTGTERRYRPPRPASRRHRRSLAPSAPPSH